MKDTRNTAAFALTGHSDGKQHSVNRHKWPQSRPLLQPLKLTLWSNSSPMCHTGLPKPPYQHKEYYQIQKMWHLTLLASRKGLVRPESDCQLACQTPGNEPKCLQFMVHPLYRIRYSPTLYSLFRWPNHQIQLPPVLASSWIWHQCTDQTADVTPDLSENHFACPLKARDISWVYFLSSTLVLSLKLSIFCLLPTIPKEGFLLRKRTQLLVGDLSVFIWSTDSEHFRFGCL